MIHFWSDRQGRNRIYTQDKYEKLAENRQVRDRAKRVELAPEEAAFMWRTWPKGFPDAQMNFLAATPERRAKIMAGAAAAQKVKDERRAAMKADLAQMNSNRIIIDHYRQQLISNGVSADEIDRRIASEWADLDEFDLGSRLKRWAPGSN